MPADPSVDTGDAEVYGMALWHQLHCLRDLRAALRFHRDGITPTHAMVADDHADHCFDVSLHLEYLRTQHKGCLKMVRKEIMVVF